MYASEASEAGTPLFWQTSQNSASSIDPSPGKRKWHRYTLCNPLVTNFAVFVYKNNFSEMYYGYTYFNKMYASIYFYFLGILEVFILLQVLDRGTIREPILGRILIIFCFHDYLWSKCKRKTSIDMYESNYPINFLFQLINFVNYNYSIVEIGWNIKVFQFRFF